jgi:hypothetical protein
MLAVKSLRTVNGVGVELNDSVSVAFSVSIFRVDVGTIIPSLCFVFPSDAQLNWAGMGSSSGIRSREPEQGAAG